MSYNNEKWSHATVNSSDVWSDRRAHSWTTTVHDTKDGKLSADDCTRQQTCSGKRLSTKQDGFETAHQNARRKTNSDLTAPRRLTATINDQRQHSPTTNKRLRPRRLTAGDDLTSRTRMTDGPTRWTTMTDSARLGWRRRRTAECPRTTALPWHSWRRQTSQHFQTLTYQQYSATRMTACRCLAPLSYSLTANRLAVDERLSHHEANSRRTTSVHK